MTLQKQPLEKYLKPQGQVGQEIDVVFALSCKVLGHFTMMTVEC